MYKVVVTGATSFLGRYLVEELKNKGVRVYAIIRPTSAHARLFEGDPQVVTVLANMDDVDLWQERIGSADAFIHLGWDGIGAAGRSNMDIQNKNVEDAVNCMKGAAALGCNRFLFSGSQAEYGPKTDIIREDDVCDPVINYGKGKLMVCHQLSALARELGITYYHTRIFSVYGIGDHPWALVSACVRTLCAGEQMKLSSCMQYWNYMHVHDAVRDLCALLFSGADSGIYNVASRDTRVLKSFVEQIHAACGGTGSCAYGSYDPAERPVSLMPDVSRLEAAIGTLEEKPFEAGIAEMVKHYKATGEQ